MNVDFSAKTAIVTGSTTQCGAAHRNRGGRVGREMRSRASPERYVASARLVPSTCPLRHLFLFVGADPNATWLNRCVAVDNKGFVLTGVNCARGTA
jgi:hypothetical protein